MTADSPGHKRSPAARCRVLLVEDNPGDAEWVRLQLRDALRAEYSVTHVASVEECRNELRRQSHDVLVLDLTLPDSEGLDALRDLTREHPQLPIVVLTGCDDNDLSLRALESGAQDYLVKDLQASSSLARSIQYSIVRHQAHELQTRLNDIYDLSTRVVHSERLAALGELAAGVAHELNQPLNGIKLICQSILRHKQEVEPAQLDEDLREIVELVGGMAETVDHLRVFSRADEPDGKCAVNPLVHNTLRLLGQQLEDLGIAVRTELCEKLPDVRGSSGRLSQVVLNLIVNARDSLCDAPDPDRARPEIRIRTALADDPALEEPRVHLEVRDNGPGVPERLKHKIFEPFFTTKPPGKGTGLGLAIAAKVVSQQGGEVSETREGDETVFRLTLVPFTASKTGRDS